MIAIRLVIGALIIALACVAWQITHELAPPKGQPDLSPHPCYQGIVCGRWPDTGDA